MDHRGVARIAKSIQRKQKADELRQALDECERERNEAHETGNKNQAEYDKQLLTLSSAFLGIAFVFIKDIVPVDHAIHFGLFYCSVVLVIACIGLVLGSFQYSISGHEVLKEYWETKGEELKSGKEGASNTLYERLVRRAVVLKWLNRLSGFTFGFSILLMASFIFINLNQEVHMNQTRDTSKVPNKEERGSNIKVPPPPTNTQKSSNDKQSSK